MKNYLIILGGILIRVCLPINYGSFANATSLNLISRKLFYELGLLMNKKKSFTIAATLLNDCGIGNINQHYDCVNVPNMGGYKFPVNSTLNSKNLIVGLVGIDEVILGREVYKTEQDWIRNKPIIESELEKWKLYSNKVNAVHVSNNSEKEQMEKYLHIPKEKIHVIPYGVDHTLFKPSKSKDKTRQQILSKFIIKDLPYFIHISESNWARKNIIRLLEAFKKSKNDGIKHKLIIVGKNDEIIYKKAKSIPDVHVLGFVSEHDLIQLLQGADALVNPSLHEGFGLPMLEAMACGVPVIASNSFCSPEMVDDAGLFSDPRDTHDISEKMLQLAKNNNLRNELGKNGIKRSKSFSWKNAAEKLLRLYEQTSESQDFDFEDCYDKSALKTLVTVCLINPKLKPILSSVVHMDFSELIDWSLDYGLDNSLTHDYLFPLKDWLIKNQNLKLKNQVNQL